MTEHQKRVPYAQLPKSLIKLPISNDAKLLFTLLNDRFQLSLKNDFKDEDGCVFCYFSNREICEKLRCAHGKATKLLRELEDAGLIYREKTIGKADHIYVGGVQEEDEPCRFPTEYPADFACIAMPNSGTGVCRFSAPSKNKENNKEFTTISEERKERLSALMERLDFNSLWTDERASGLRQLRWHIVTVMETEFPFLRLAGKDFPTEEVRSAFYQLKKEDLEEILADFLSDPAAFGSMRQRLFEAGRKHELEDGIVLASNDSWAHEAACQGAEPLKPHETEEAS